MVGIIRRTGAPSTARSPTRHRPDSRSTYYRPGSARTEAFLTEGRVDEARHETELAADAAHDIDEWLRGALRRWLDRTGSDRIVDGPIARPYRLQESG